MSNQIAKTDTQSYGRDKHGRWILSADQAIANNTAVAVAFNAITNSSLQGILTHTLGSGTFTVQKAGIFYVDGSIGISSSGGANTGERKCYIAVGTRNEQNGANLSPPQADPSPTMVSAFGVYRLAVGDTIQLIGRHTQGAGLNLVGSATNLNQCCRIEIAYLG